jgi:ubiquinone/menaquinone biosynthesis C-methylase UbiE
MNDVDYDAELQLLNEVLRGAYDIERHDRVLDIGCGGGQTTRDAARLAAEGEALGVDLSADAIAHARDLARAEGIHNVTFEHADAQAHPFPSARFDLAISRFGTMFFVDPVAAFANIGRALRPAGRLVMMVFQARERNGWTLAIEETLSGFSDAPAWQGLDPFSLGDPATVESILDAGGFTDVTFTDVHRPMYFGQDAAAAIARVGSFAYTREVLARLDGVSADRALGRLRETLAVHASPDGVWLDSRAWIVKARRR